ncbi:MAG: tRNA (adenosine(37)-N6)-threonylcarbamoyltransferase complex dimerization subunit type 1 TsaB [Acidimicrobiales bacterium]
MIVLGIETATAQVGCALGGSEGTFASFAATRGRRHAETLVPAIDFVCRQARVELSEIGVIAVDVGPGLFTGLRVGVATAKAMAQALRVPMVGLSSLDLLAFPVRHARGLIAAVIDARRGEVFCALYRPVPGGVQRVTDPRACAPGELATELVAMGEDCLLVGDGAVRYAELFDDAGHVALGGDGLAHPSAASLVELAHPRAIREDFVHASELEPTYLRKADAQVHWEQRASA